MEMHMIKFDVDDVVVLVIDDDETSRMLVSNAVRAMGGKAIVAVDGSDGLRAAHEYVPTVVVCDYRMAPVDGASFLAGLRNSTTVRVARIPVIMFTSERDVGVVGRLRGIGCTDYIVKPFNMKGFVERLNAAIMLNDKSQQILNAITADISEPERR